MLAMICALLALGGMQPETRPLDEQPYLGLSVRDTPEGVVVGWVQPGPLGGDGFESAVGIRRADNLVAIDGEPVSAAAELNARISARSPGDRVTLTLRRSPEADPSAAVPKGGPGGEERVYTVTLASREQWTGTIGRGGRAIAPPGEGEFESLIRRHAEETGIWRGDEGVGGGLESLLEHLRGVIDQNLDPACPDAVVNALRHPLRLDAVERPIAGLAVRAASGEIGDARALIAGVLDAPADAARSGEPPGDLETMRREAAMLVRELRDSVRISGEHFPGHLATMRRGAWHITAGSLAIQRDTVLPAMADRVVFLRMRHEELVRKGALQGPPRVPRGFEGAVEGDVWLTRLGSGGKLEVIGGDGPNIYDMSRVGAVFDPGGDDVYRFAPAPGLRQGDNHIIEDLAGDDLYEATADFCGPGTGVLGVSVVIDHDGSDTYRSTGMFSIGAGLLGIGIIIDHAGDDSYENTGPGSGWSMGVGFYGAGLIIDRSGNDRYHAEKLSQGVGGPGGFGAIIDAAGNDRYTANGPNFGSAYGTPGVYLGMSQGFGIGVRGYAAGGVGAIYDLSGNDRYEAGEFSQAGGYSFGLGILHDMGGDDRYIGNRYGQAFGAHQAAGILIDDAGNDSYWSMTAASQAGSWDESAAMLIERGGNDTYRCDGLGQGSAAQQAIAVLLDLGGDDSFEGTSTVQGRGGGNEYHYGAAGVFSFSALLGLGGGENTYSSGRGRGTRVRTGAFREDAPANSPLYGLFVDE